MKRWTLRIVLCLLLGVVTTVGVAWYAAAFFWMGSGEHTTLSGSQSRDLCSDYLPKAASVLDTSFHGFRESGRGWTRLWASNGPQMSPLYEVEVRQSGWPLRALTGFASFLDSSSGTPAGIARSGVWVLDWEPKDNIIWLPLRPILPGFLINTLFYAVIWFGIFFGPGATRRGIRRRRGRCVKCGYDLLGDFGSGCSECGWGRDAKLDASMLEKLGPTKGARMSIGSQINEAARKLSEQRFEDAIVPASIALSATARLEYPSDGDKKAYHNFLDNNLRIISKIGWVSFGIVGPVNFRYRKLTGRRPGIAVRSTSEMLYDVVRCTAIHEAKVPDNLTFTSDSVIQTGHDGELVLPIDVIYGLLIAVVASPENANENAADDPTFSFDGTSVKINDLWGKRDRVTSMLGV